MTESDVVPPAPPADAVSARSAFLWERIVAAAVAVWVVAFLSYMILSPDSSFDPARVYFLKILLSLSCAIFVSTLPGFFHVKYTAGGLGLRAAGGAAVFWFVYSFSPAVPALGLAEPRVEQVGLADFRSLGGPDGDDVASSPVAITIPVAAKNVAQSAVSGTIRRVDLTFRLGERKYAYAWAYFVRLVPGIGGTWLSADAVRPASPIDLFSGQTSYEEIMHLSPDALLWADFLEVYLALVDPPTLEIGLTLDDRVERQVCVIADHARVKDAIMALREVNGEFPAAFTVRCA